ncbi:MAG: hypothetical protein KGD74_03915 [Candidatus Lokiarchaeota archaeon]|nr:hypothetical protein [Candidatus Lokiarchaeota archaeon]
MNKKKHFLLIEFLLIISILGIIFSSFFTYSNDYSYRVKSGETNIIGNEEIAGDPPTYDEDFTTDIYKDSSSTNVSGWGMDAIKLPYKNVNLVGSNDTWGMAHSLYISGDLAYVATEWTPGGGLEIFNISDPTNPYRVSTYPIGGYKLGFGVFVAGDYAYIAAQPDGLIILDISDPTQPTFEGQCWIWLEYWFNDVYVSGNYAYVAGWGVGFGIIDVSNPSNPFMINDIGFNGGEDVFIDGSNAYVCFANGEFRIFDISNPYNIITSYSADLTDIQFGCTGVFVKNNYAYVSIGLDGLKIFDVSTPSSPIELGSYSSVDMFENLFISGDYAYITDSASGLLVLNISDPTNPSYITNHPTPSWAMDVVVSGNYAYVLDGYNGIQVINISLVGHYEPLATAQSETIYSSSDSLSLLNATLSSMEFTPPDTNIEYYLSPDNGNNWEQVIPDTEHYFTNNGKDLKWKAILTTSNSSITPRIASLNISYSTIFDQTTLLTPSDGFITNDNTPTFNWNSVTGALKYLLELDTVSSFNSPNLINETVGSTSFTPSYTIADDQWFWRVAVNDSDADLGVFSGIRSITIDTTPPVAPSLISPANNTSLKPIWGVGVFFNWNSVSDADHYIWQICYYADFHDLVTTVNDIPNSNFSRQLGVAYGIPLYWKVSTVDAASNEGTYSEIYNFTLINPNIVYVNSGGGGDDDDEGPGGSRFESIPGYNLMIVIALIGVISIIIARKYRKLKQR